MLWPSGMYRFGPNGVADGSAASGLDADWAAACVCVAATGATGAACARADWLNADRADRRPFDGVICIAAKMAANP